MSRPRSSVLTALVVLAFLSSISACGSAPPGQGEALGSSEIIANGGAVGDAPVQGPTIVRPWLSGASGDGVADGSFGKWRGRDVQIAGTWNDNFESQEQQWSLRPEFDYGAWQGNIDVAVGAIYKDRGETWADAAAGAYDRRWAAALANVASLRAGRSGTTYIRFAHEFNGTWFPWSVTAAETTDFKTAWARFRALQLEAMPQAKLVFCPNTFSADPLALDWRNAFPGADLVDVEAVDVYNQYPFVVTPGDFDDVINKVDVWGAPQGLEQHRKFAEAHGLPFAVPEWSSNADFGDGSVYINEFHRWLGQHGGRGPGQVIYEILFNVDNFGDDKFQLFPENRQPQATATYVSLW